MHCNIVWGGSYATHLKTSHLKTSHLKTSHLKTSNEFSHIDKSRMLFIYHEKHLQLLKCSTEK